MTTNKILQQVDQIAATASSKEKEALLKKFIGDPTFLRCMKAAYNPFITFGLRPTRVSGQGKLEFTEETWLLLNALATRKLTGNEAKSAVDRAMSAMTTESAELFWRLVNKDMRAGFGDTLLNKVAPGSIPEFPYMRCTLPDKAKPQEWDWSQGVVSQLKADGMFMNVNCDATGFVWATTRQGNIVPIMDHLEIGIELTTRMPRGYQAHGELLIERDGQIVSRAESNGIANKIVNGEKPAPGDRIIFKLWDIIPLTSVKPKGECETPYGTRLSQLIKAFPKAEEGETPRCIRVIETKVVKSWREAVEHFIQTTKDGHEGTVIKRRTGVWKDTSSGSKDVVKMKVEAQVDLRIGGYREGEPGKKTEKTFGALICHTSDGLLEVGVGSGLTDKMREQINADRAGYLGKIVQVTCNDILAPSKSNALHSLFLPRFDEVRTDKTEADSLERVQSILNSVKEGKVLSA